MRDLLELLSHRFPAGAGPPYHGFDRPKHIRREIASGADVLRSFFVIMKSDLVTTAPGSHNTLRGSSGDTPDESSRGARVSHSMLVFARYPAHSNARRTLDVAPDCHMRNLEAQPSIS